MNVRPVVEGSVTVPLVAVSVTWTSAVPASTSDVDAGTAEVQGTLTATNGTVTLPSTTGLTFITGTGTNDTTFTVQATLADINADLDGLIFQPVANYNGPAS